MFSDRPRNAMTAREFVSRIKKIPPPVLDFGLVKRLSLDDAKDISLALLESKHLPKTILLSNLTASDKIAAIIVILSGLAQRCKADYFSILHDAKKHNYNSKNPKHLELMAQSITFINLRTGLDIELLMDNDEQPTKNAKELAKLYNALRTTNYIFFLPHSVVNFFSQHGLMNTEKNVQAPAALKPRASSLPNIDEKINGVSYAGKKPGGSKQ